ncbi:hypothetical protein AB4304_13920 [Vibrio breoganii]
MKKLIIALLATTSLAGCMDSPKQDLLENMICAGLAHEIDKRDPAHSDEWEHQFILLSNAGQRIFEAHQIDVKIMEQYIDKNWPVYLEDPDFIPKKHLVQYWTKHECEDRVTKHSGL